MTSRWGAVLELLHALPFGFSMGGYTSIRNAGRNEEVSKCRTTD